MGDPGKLHQLLPSLGAGALRQKSDRCVPRALGSASGVLTVNLRAVGPEAAPRLVVTVRKVLASHGSACVEGKLGLVGPPPPPQAGRGWDVVWLWSRCPSKGHLLIVPCPPGFSPSQGSQWFLSPKLVFKNASWPAETPGGVCWLYPRAQACRGFGSPPRPGFSQGKVLGGSWS